MRIAQIAPIAERVPPKKYGGTERVVYNLTEELVKRGHEVTLFATGDSITSAKLVSVFSRGTREAGVKDPHGINEWSLLNIAKAYGQQNEFDIIHDHNAPVSLLAANFSTVPVLATLHGSITPLTRRLYQTLNNVNLITLSEAQAKRAEGLNLAGMVYNGLNMNDHPFGEKSQGYLLFVGRISPEKGLKEAIEVAQFFNLPLVIAAKLDTPDRKYFEEYIEPHLSNELIRWVGEVDEAEKNKLYAGAICLLHPVSWPEPFGLTMIEAMASGCPVVAFEQGSIPEIIKHGETGFVVKDLDGMVESVSNIAKIDRRNIRNYALENFNAQIMTDRYEKIYRQILTTKNPATSPRQRRLELLLEPRNSYS